MNETTRLERTTHVVRGEHCELRLEAGQLMISKERGTQDAPTKVVVPVTQVRGATLDRPSRGQPGWLHVAVVGGSPTPTSDLGATLDPYTLPVTGRNLGQARRLVRLVTKHVQARGLPPEPAAGTQTTSSSVMLTTSPPAEPPPAPAPAAEPAVDDQPLDVAEDPDEVVTGSEATTDDPIEVAAGATEAATDATDAADGVAHTLAESLQQLADLHAAGALTDAEFQRAKARVLEEH